MVSSKHLCNSTHVDSFWLFLIRRDLTERPLLEHENAKKFYMDGEPFLIEIANAVFDFKKLDKLDEKERRNMGSEDKEKYTILQCAHERRYEYLHKAAQFGYEKCIDYILTNMNLGPDSNDYEVGTTALCMAAQNNRVHCLDKLLSLDANMENVDAFGATPLCYAVIGGALESVKFLLKKGAKSEGVGVQELEMLDELEDCDIKVKQEIKALILSSKDKSIQSSYVSGC